VIGPEREDSGPTGIAPGCRHLPWTGASGELPLGASGSSHSVLPIPDPLPHRGVSCSTSGADTCRLYPWIRSGTSIFASGGCPTSDPGLGSGLASGYPVYF